MAKSAKQSEIPAKARVELLKRQQWFDLAYKLPATCIKWGIFGWMAYRASLAISSLAGETTSVGVLVKFFGEGRLPCGLAAILGVSGVGYGLMERREPNDIGPQNTA